MDEHLTREQIAALLDEPHVVPGGTAHLDVCADCASEYEAMSRTRMALSGLPDLAAPADTWDRIAKKLPAQPIASEVDFARAPQWWMRAQRSWTPGLAAAAIVLLFLGGLGVGRMLGPAASADGGAEMTAAADSPAMQFDRDRGGADLADTAPGAGAELATLNGVPEYQRTFAELQALRRQGPSGEQLATDPAAVAERLTRLDALIEASREALRTAPSDPALNDFLFDVVDERASVAGQLNQTIRQASMEY